MTPLHPTACTVQALCSPAPPPASAAWAVQEAGVHEVPRHTVVEEVAFGAHRLHVNHSQATSWTALFQMFKTERMIIHFK